MKLYETLGVPEDAAQDDIKAAFRKQSMKHHPDRGGDREAFQKVEEAYRILSDEDKRRRYDETGRMSDGPTEDELVLADALGGLQKLMSECVQQVDVRYTNILDAVLGKVRAMQLDLQQEETKLRRAVDKHEKAIKRLKAKEGENIAAHLLQHVISAMQGQMEVLDRHHKTSVKMVDILGAHEYRVDEGGPQMSGTASADLDALVATLFGKRMWK